MGLIKKICLRVALNREQRLVIWNALQFSDYTYRKRGNIDRAVGTSTVIAKTEGAFGVNAKHFTKEEVNAMLDAHSRRVVAAMKQEVQDAYQDGRQDGIAEVLDNIRNGRGLVVGEIVEVEETPEENKETEQADKPSAPSEGEAPAAEQKQDE